MSRSGYATEIDDNWAHIRYRGHVASAIRGKRGQRLLRDLKEALEAMPEKRLVSKVLENDTGEVCALGAVGKLRAMDMSELDPENREEVGKAFDIAWQLAAEIVYENDEVGWYEETPEDRWKRMYRWVCNNLQTLA